MKAGLYASILLIQCSLIFINQPGSSLTYPHTSKKSRVQFDQNRSTLQACKEIDWATWSSFTGRTANATINNQGSNINVTMNSSFEFTSSPQIERYEAFKRSKTPVLNTTVPRTTWSKQSGTTTICFSQSVKEPVLLIASLGSYKERIETTISFSEPYVILYNGGGMKADNNSTLTGREGYALIKFPGDIKCITISSSSYENFTDLTLGVPVCPEGFPKPVLDKAPVPSEPAPVLASVPKPAPKPEVVAPKPAPAVVEPAPKPVTTIVPPKPAPVLASVPKPEPKPEVVTPKPAPVVVEPAPKPVTAIVPSKPAPITSVPKPEPKPEVVAPKPAPAIVEPAPKPVTAIVPPKPAPVLASVPKPEPKPEVVTPKPASAVVEPAPKPVTEIVPSKPAPVLASVPKPAPKPEAVAPKSAPVVVEPKPKPVTAIPSPKSAAPVGAVPKTKPLTADPLSKIQSGSETIASEKRNSLKIEVFDYDGMDYDSVALKLNGMQIGPNVIQLPLYKRYGSPEFTYPLTLNNGKNTLEIHAISEGLKPLTTICILIISNEGRKKMYFSLKAKETAVIEL